MSSFQAYSATSLSASQTVANFEAAAKGNILPKAGADLSETTGAHDLGSTTYRWRYAYADGIASSVTFSQPVTFSAAPVFNTSTTFSNLLGYPQLISVAYASPTGTPTFETPTSTGHIGPFNTVTVNTIDQATLTTNQISLPSGSYVFTYSGFRNVAVLGTVSSYMYIFDATASITVSDIGPQNPFANSGNYRSIWYRGRFSLATTSSIEVRLVLDSAAAVAWYDGSAFYSDGQFSTVCHNLSIFKVS